MFSTLFSENTKSKTHKRSSIERVGYWIPECDHVMLSDMNKTSLENSNNLFPLQLWLEGPA